MDRQAIYNLMFDAADGVACFDGEKALSKAEVNAKIAQLCFEYTGLNVKSTEKEINRALKSEKCREFFAIVEEILEKKIQTGMKESEFFNNYVETRNIADGDDTTFWAEKDIILQVEKVSGSAHDLIAQQLGEGESYNVPTSVYGIKVGADIRLFLMGRKNWSDFVEAVVKAYINATQEAIYTEFTTAATTLPLPDEFLGTGTLGAATKADFDELIENVQISNDNAPVVIMGTKTALKKMNTLVNGANAVDWMADSQKESIANTGILGNYEGSVLLEIPQRFAKNDYTSAHKLIDNTKIYIMPAVDDNKFVKMVDGGEIALETTEIGKTQNDQQQYEVQRRMGFGAVLTRNFAIWTIA